MKKWTMSEMRRSWKLAARLRNRSVYRPSLETLESRVTPANINITGFHYNPAITGQNLQETALTPTNVNATNFGKLANAQVDGYVYSEPLYMANLMIGGQPHNVAFVATEHDSLYALDVITDSSVPTGLRLSPLWQRSFIDPANGITTVPTGDVGSGDIVPEIGITGAPVIDSATNTLYLVAKTKEVRADGNHYVQKLYAIDLTSATGANKVAPYTIGDSHGGDGYANQTSVIHVAGNGSDSSGGDIKFDAFSNNQRPSLQLLNGRVYVGWSSHGDQHNYHGWVVGFNETTLQPEKWFNATPNARGSGIWQSEGAISTDGTFLYFAIGNAFSGPNPGFDPAHGNYSEAVLKLDPTQAGTDLGVADYFVPFNWQQLDNQDADLGSGGVMLLPDSVGGNGHTHLMVETGKDGHIYLLDRDNMGKFNPTTNMIVQDVVAGPGGVWGNPAFYQESANSGLLIYHGSGSDTREFRITNGQIQQVGGSFIAYRSNQTFGFPGAQPIITGNGSDNTTALDFELQSDNYGTQGPEQLHVYMTRPAAQTGTMPELYNSNQTGLRDRLAGSVKFTSSIVSNGWVFVGQEFNFSVFGLFPTHTAAPAAPTNLHGMGVSPTAIEIDWTSPSPNTATGIKIFRSTDGTNFSPLTTVGAAVTTYTDTGLNQSGTYFYKIAATNQVGDSAQTAAVQLNPLIAAPVLSIDNISSVKVSLVWTQPSVANDHYSVERSTDPTFATFTTVAMNLHMTSYVDNNSTAGQYYYRVRAFTASNQPALSNIVAVKIGAGSQTIDYFQTNSFPPNPPDLQANGDAQFAEGTARLVHQNNVAGSVFSVNEKSILNWTDTFSVRLHEGTQPNYANGFTFTIQAISSSALGLGGPGLGYQGIPNSVTIKFETTTGAAENGTGGSTGLFFGGDQPTTPHQPGEANFMLDATKVNLMSQSSKTVTLTYAYNPANPSASVLHEDIADPDHPGQDFVHDYMVDIPSLLGLPVNGNTIGYVGFTGSTGTNSFWELEDVTSWRYLPAEPAAPHGLTVASGSTTNTLNWKATSADELGYYVERSTSQTSGFTRIASLPAGTWSYTDMGLMNPQQYFYRVQAFNRDTMNQEHDSGYSNVASGAVVTVAFPNFATHGNLTSQTTGQTPPVNVFPGNPAVMRLTDGRTGEGTSVFYNTVIGTGNFSTTFTLQDHSGPDGSADGLAFVIQNDPRGVTALGATGGGLGYGGITNSVAVMFDLYSSGSHLSTTKLLTGGSTDKSGAIDMGPSGITLGNGDPLLVTLTYTGTTLTETVQDTVTSRVFTTSFTVNLAQVIGGPTAYVGFTGGTGGEDATQDILSWNGMFSQAPPQISSFVVSAPASTTAGTAIQVTVTAKDQNGNSFTGYTGTVHFSSNDGQAMLPANYQFTAADMGTHMFTVTLKTAGNDTVAVSDTVKASAAGSATVMVTPAAVSKLAVSGFPNVIRPGTPGMFTVAATDAYGNTNPTYRGTIHFTSSDAQAMLPANYQFMAADNGSHVFTATLNTLGTQSITATDINNGNITGTQSGIMVQVVGVVNIDFSGGFANHGNLTANGSAKFPGGTPAVLRLTDGGNGEAASAFYNSLVGTGTFTTTFTFQMRAGSNPIADGLTFVIQNDPRGVTALGQGGGAQGYGTDANDGKLPAIQSSIAIKFDAYKNFPQGNDGDHSSTGLYVSGHRPNNPPGSLPGDQPVDLAGSGINFNGSAQLTTPHIFMVTLAYNSTTTTLTETIKDMTTNATFTHMYTINIAQVVGGSVAVVGFTAGTGGLNAIQDILTWTGQFQQPGGLVVALTNFSNVSSLTANTLSNNPAVGIFTSPPQSVPFSSGFANHSNIATNGGASFVGTNPTVLRITDGGGGEARSAFYTTQVGTGSFTTTFTLRDTGTEPLADGLSFVIQNDPRGLTALGGGGGDEGYGGITNSIAVKFDLWTDGTHGSETGLFTGGQSPAGFESQDVPLAPVNLHSGHPIKITLSYDGATLTELVQDTVTNDTFLHTYLLNLAQVVGGPLAYVGFTGGTGGATSTQDILNWSGTFQAAPVLRLTDGRAGEASTVFANTQAGTGPFTTTFTLRDQPVNGSADGVTFIIQADPRGTAALGGGGGGLGYAGITNSIAIQFDLYGHGSHNPLTGLFSGGESPDSDPAKDVPITGLSLGSGNPIQVTLTYDGVNLTETLMDTVTHAMFSHTYMGVNLAQLIGGNAAFVGFGAGTGGETAIQDILSWNGSFAPPQAAHLRISTTNATTAGTAIQVTVTALDQNNLPLPNYLGTVHFTSSDSIAGLPPDYIFKPNDNGVHTFTVVLNAVGTQSITVTDAGTATINGTQTGITVKQGAFLTLDYSSGFGNSTNLTRNGSANFVGPNGTAVGVFAGHMDIGTAGDPSVAGSATFSNGAYTLTASGSDIWDVADHMQYLYEPLVGNGQIVARLLSASTSDFWTKVGLMIRGDLTAGAVNDFMLDTPNPGHQEPVMQWRDTANMGTGDTGNHGNASTPNVATPMWLKLVRVGNTFIGFWAVDNNGSPGPWNQLAVHNTTMPATVYVGLALTAHNNGAVASATFDHVSVSGVTAPLTPAIARLTDGGTGEAGSVYNNNKVDVTYFTTTFVLRDQPGMGAADGVSFVIQNDPRGASALGSGGGGEGYAGVTNSIAIKFDLYGHGSHNPLTGLFINGQDPAGDPTRDVPLTGINLGSGHPLQITLTYNGTTLTETVVDTVTNATFTHDYLVNITQIVGGSLAYVGFSGGTGGETATQDILSWTGTFPTAAPTVASLAVNPALTATVAGTPLSLTVTALDPNGHRVAYTGKVHFTSTDPQAVLPADYTFTAADAGQHVFMVTLKTAGNQAVFITDTANGQLATLAGIVVSPAATSKLVVSDFPSPTTAGAEGAVIVTAQDPYGNVTPGYTGTVHVTSSDSQAQLEGNHTFTAADAGRYAFGVILKTAGTQSITATDTVTSSITGTQSGIVVNPAAADHFFITTSVSTTVAGTPFDVTVTVQDAFNNIVTGYTGTITFSSGDPFGATLPPDYTFTAANQGVHTFPGGATLYTVGTWDVTATDTSTGITGSAFVTVTPAAATSLAVFGYPSPTERMVPHNFTVAALDPYGNVATGYTGTVTFSSDEDHADLPPDYTFTAADAGMHVFSATFNRFGTFSLTATDTSDPTITGTQSDIEVPNGGGGAPSTGRGSGISALGVFGLAPVDVVANVPLARALRLNPAAVSLVANGNGAAASVPSAPVGVQGAPLFAGPAQRNGQPLSIAGDQIDLSGDAQVRALDRVLANWDDGLATALPVDELLRDRLV